jgi:thiol-disulfide isomerase/thioredoxin
VIRSLRPALLATLTIGSLVLAALAAYSASAAPADDEVKLVKVRYDELIARIAANKGAKLTMVDLWATWCAPCKENFPHVVEMHHKYASKGLAVVSLSLDDPDQPKKIADAEAFLKEKRATFPNYYLAEATEAAFDKLNIGVIPAVFLYGPDGKEIQRFTLEDVDKPFTYEQVEAAVREKLGVK